MFQYAELWMFAAAIIVLICKAIFGAGEDKN